MKLRQLWPSAAISGIGLLVWICMLTLSRAFGESAEAVYQDVPAQASNVVVAATPPVAVETQTNTPDTNAPLAVETQTNSMATSAAPTVEPQQTQPTNAIANPAPVAATPAVTPSATAPAPTQITSRQSGEKTLYSFQADGLELRSALASFARANSLNIVPDNDVTGTVTLEIRDLPLNEMMRALLEASDCIWSSEGGLIRVHNTETRTFYVDYLRLSRKGVGQSSAVLNSGTTGGSSGGGTSGGGGGGGGGNGGGGNGGGGGGSTSWGGSSINLTADNPIDFWKELKEELGFVLTEKGKGSLSINMTAGILQVTDRPSALKRVENYLKGVETSIHRQVDLEARVYSVTLSDQFQFGIDWVHVAKAYGGSLGFGGATLPVANGGSQLADSALGGLNRTVGSTTPGDNLSTIVFKNFNTEAAINALQLQGTVEVISKPRVRTLNNQTAMIKVGEDVPFFNSSTTFLPGSTFQGSIPLQQTVVSTITVGTILSLTPQISEDNWVSLDISPVLTSLKAVVLGGIGSGSSSGSTSATAPDLDTKQASTIVRVHDGNTIVIGGLIQTQKSKNLKKIPLLGDIPWIGRVLFTGTFEAKQKNELVIFVTPHIIQADEPSIQVDESSPVKRF
jgi:MSHA type pilus biogenesis protein MshL